MKQYLTKLTHYAILINSVGHSDKKMDFVNMSVFFVML